MIRVHEHASRLTEGMGVRFSITLDGIPRDAFVVRYRGQLLAYLNTCRHQALPLDFGDGRFFDDDYDAIVCCQHGARYRPESGECFAGPCVGARLTKLRVEEREGAVWCGANTTEQGDTFTRSSSTALEPCGGLDSTTAPSNR